MLLGFLFRIFFTVIFDTISMERTWIRELKSSFNMETIKMFRGEGNWKVHLIW